MAFDLGVFRESNRRLDTFGNWHHVPGPRLVSTERGIEWVVCTGRRRQNASQGTTSAKSVAGLQKRKTMFAVLKK